MFYCEFIICLNNYLITVRLPYPKSRDAIASKNTTIWGSIVEGEGNFGDTSKVKNTQILILGGLVDTRSSPSVLVLWVEPEPNYVVVL